MPYNVHTFHVVQGSCTSSDYSCAPSMQSEELREHGGSNAMRLV